jgi:putative SOS response-associated peptidase YedK
MCGRYGRFFDGDEEQSFADFFDVLHYVKEGWKRERYNCPPGEKHPIVIHQDGERRAILAHWGWRRDFAPKFFPNARGEEILGKRTFRDAALNRQRCLVPARLFYEWREADRQPFAFALRTRAWFGIGALWEPVADGLAFTLLTVPANAVVAPIHHRMPVIIAPERYGDWLDPERPWEATQEQVAPYPSELMESWPIGPRISSNRSEGADLVAPVQAGEPPRQQSLF